MKPVRALLAISILCGAGTAFPQSPPQPPASALTAAIGTYCVPCHNARLAEGKIALNALDPQHPWAEADLWERVLRQLRARTMPPTENPRPDSRTYDALVSELASTLDRGNPLRTLAVGQRVTDLELAAHLAKLLWNGSPDTELLDVARKGTAKKGLLDDPDVLEAEVRRMLADPKIAGFVAGFFDEWLGLNQLSTMPADAAAFPEFDPPLRQALRRETELFVESQLREDRPAVELWTAKYTYVNDRLARHYGLPYGTGNEFRRVPLEGTERAGLLGQGSFLVTTSALTRHPAVNEPSTSPAARAKWIRVHFLGVPMRPPLPNLPQLQKGVLLSAQLRTLPDPSCTACHSNFFPPGYALENFDPMGRWRSEFGPEPQRDEIDVSGTLVDGTEFTGPAELRRALLERQDAFLTTITERLLAYAVNGKPGLSLPTPAERMPVVRAILRDAQKKRYTWSGLFAGIAASAIFQAQ